MDRALVIHVINRKKREKQHKSSNSQLLSQLVVIQKKWRYPEVIQKSSRSHPEVIQKSSRSHPEVIQKSSRSHSESIQKPCRNHSKASYSKVIIPFQSFPSHKSCQSIHLFSSTIRLSNQLCWLLLSPE